MWVTYEVVLQLTRVLSVQLELGITRVGEVLHEGGSGGWRLEARVVVLFLWGLDWGIVMVNGVDVHISWHWRGSVVACNSRSVTARRRRRMIFRHGGESRRVGCRKNQEGKRKGKKKKYGVDRE